MRARRFATNKPLWILISLALFFALWFVPFLGMAFGFQAGLVFMGLSDPHSEKSELWQYVMAWSAIYVIPAVSIGWVIQCVVVVIGAAIKDGANKP